MIVEALMELARVILTALIGLLPAAADALALPSSSALSNTIGGYLGPFDRIAPIHEAITAIWFVVSVLFPPLFAYLAATWAYGWLPFIGKSS